MKYAIVIMDGASGWPVEELGGLTTLQRAATPNLDRMAREGMVGLAVTVPEGEEPSSAAACTSILGFDPSAPRIGRGAIEAASLGIHLAPGEVALRMNLVTIEEGLMRSYAAGHITTEEASELVNELDSALGGTSVRMYPGVAYRHILVIGGHPELVECAFTPPHDISDRPVAGSEPSGPAAEVLLEIMAGAVRVLADSEVNRRRVAAGRLPATDVWPFWPGVAPAAVPGFSEVYGRSAALTSGVDLLGGLAEIFGIERLAVAGVTDGQDSDHAAQVEGAIAALRRHDVVIIHVEAPDEAGHAGDVGQKVEAIAAIDELVVSRLLQAPMPLRVLAMPDHPTPVALKTHVAEPVPFVLWGPGVAHNGAERFDEAGAAATGLVVDPGHRIMGALLGGS